MSHARRDVQNVARDNTEPLRRQRFCALLSNRFGRGIYVEQVRNTHAPRAEVTSHGWNRGGRRPCCRSPHPHNRTTRAEAEHAAHATRRQQAREQRPASVQCKYGRRDKQDARTDGDKDKQSTRHAGTGYRCCHPRVHGSTRARPAWFAAF